MIVYEYILDKDNNIITIQLWGENEKPELKNNPIPSDEIMQNSLIDRFGNFLYKLENNEIIENIILLTAEQNLCNKISEKKISEIIRILIKGISNSNDDEFLSLKKEVME